MMRSAITILSVILQGVQKSLATIESGTSLGHIATANHKFCFLRMPEPNRIWKDNIHMVITISCLGLLNFLLGVLHRSLGVLLNSLLGVLHRSLGVLLDFLLGVPHRSLGVLLNFLLGVLHRSLGVLLNFLVFHFIFL